MGDDLDLSSLTDDQLVALARLVAAELGQRSDAVRGAAQSAILDEGEKARIAAEAAKVEAARIRAAERQKIYEQAAEKVRQAAPSTTLKNWAKNKTIALMVRETLGPGWSCHVWRREGEIRVYLDRQLGGEVQKVTYYASGNSRKAPGSLELKGMPDADRDTVKLLCTFARRQWSFHPQFSCDEAVEADVVAIPYPQDYLDHKRNAA